MEADQEVVWAVEGEGVSGWWREPEAPSFEGSGGMQNNDSHPSFHCVSEHLFCFYVLLTLGRGSNRLQKRKK